MATTEMTEQELTTDEREHVMDVAMVLMMKELVSQGHDIYDLIDMLPFDLDEDTIKEMDRQGVW